MCSFITQHNATDFTSFDRAYNLYLLILISDHFEPKKVTDSSFKKSEIIINHPFKKRMDKSMLRRSLHYFASSIGICECSDSLLLSKL